MTSFKDFFNEVVQNKKYKPKNWDALRELVADESIYLGDIDISLLTDLSGVFRKSTRKNFDGIEKWDTSKVKTMNRIFEDSHFNWDISNWDTSNVSDFAYMFYNCKDFNQDLSKWSISNGKYFTNMFGNCKKFNQNLSKWDCKNAISTYNMLSGCTIKDEYKPKNIED